MEKEARIVGLAMSGLAVVVGLYMGLLVLGDWYARYVLGSDQARNYAIRVCAETPGCKALSIRAGYDWRNTNRKVIYSAQVEYGGMGADEMSKRLAWRAAKESGALGWVLAVPMTLNFAATGKRR